MTPVKHSIRSHSKIGPSAASRWLACPGSVREADKWENRQTTYAREGTAAHEFAEHTFTQNISPEDYEGGVIVYDAKEPKRKFLKASDDNPAPDGWHVFPINDEMVEGVELYHATIREYVALGYVEIDIETKLDMSDVHPALFGTGDALLYDPVNRRLVVIDFKYGKGYAVEVLDNAQLLTYAVGGLRRHHNRGVDHLTLVLVQPRAYHKDGPVRVQEVDPIDLTIFEEILRRGSALTDDPDAPLDAGEHCKFCPAGHACVALDGAVMEIIAKITGIPVEEIDVDNLPSVTHLDAATMGVLVRKRAIVEMWVKHAMMYALDQAQQGNIPDGCKLVDKRPRRKWFDPNGIADTLRVLGLDDSDIFNDPKMKSVAQVEKAIGKKEARVLLEGTYESVSSGVTLALIDDPRESRNPGEGGVFGSVEDE